MSDVKNLMDDLWYKVKTTAGYCASNPNIKDLKDYLEKGEQYANNAHIAFIVSGADGKAITNLKTAAEHIGKVKNGIDGIRNLCIDVNAFSQISNAIDVLNKVGINAQGSEEAALAYGELFVGVGHFASKLPPPVNSYAQILENCGSFFHDMQKAIDPDKRWKNIFKDVDGYVP
jgi:hypothetical protein